MTYKLRMAIGAGVLAAGVAGLFGTLEDENQRNLEHQEVCATPVMQEMSELRREYTSAANEFALSDGRNTSNLEEKAQAYGSFIEQNSLYDEIDFCNRDQEEARARYYPMIGVYLAAMIATMVGGICTNSAYQKRKQEKEAKEVAK